MSQRSYPESVVEVLDEQMTFPPAVLTAVCSFADAHPWQGSIDERKAKFKQLNRDLSEACHFLVEPDPTRAALLEEEGVPVVGRPLDEPRTYSNLRIDHAALVVLDHLRDASDARRDDRATARHRFDQHASERLLERGADDEVQLVQNLGYVQSMTQKLHRVFQAELSGHALENGSPIGAMDVIADHPEFGSPSS